MFIEGESCFNTGLLHHDEGDCVGQGEGLVPTSTPQSKRSNI